MVTGLLIYREKFSGTLKCRLDYKGERNVYQCRKFFGTYLDFSSPPCYTNTRYKTPKNKVVQGVPPISGVRLYTYSICLPRHSSDVHASMDARLIAARK